MTHSGKTTFAAELEIAMEPDAVVIDQDNHAAFINAHYRKLRPSEGPNTLKFSITNTIVTYAVDHSSMHIILSNSNLHEPSRRDVLRFFQEKGFKRILVYFDLPLNLLEERINRTQRNKTIFRSASSFQGSLRSTKRLKTGSTDSRRSGLFLCHQGSVRHPCNHCADQETHYIERSEFAQKAIAQKYRRGSATAGFLLFRFFWGDIRSLSGIPPASTIKGKQ
ncbi:ATP-binding protein [Paenibacillus phoenicis]|uniref:ATP-binding protein n=2 Tax=Paenibacillus phoenicis TaxID=554117 RepID=A0ABU5PGP2_9BACL|nr:ATP-binding protein [Paenibacillus phoenicis]MEA3569113.1 ATP-binding protein [Paenibacillus phoenicis]